MAENYALSQGPIRVSSPRCPSAWRPEQENVTPNPTLQGECNAVKVGDRMAYSEPKDWNRDDLRRRGLGLFIALLLEAIIIIAILSLSMRAGGPAASPRGLSTFSLEAEAESAAAADKSETQTPLPQKQQSTVTPPLPKPLLPPVNPVKAPPPNPDFIKVSKSEFDAMDLSKLPA